MESLACRTPFGIGRKCTALKLEAKTSKRKVDPATGKTIPNASDLNRKKRPTRKPRTAAEKIARSGSAGEKRSQKAKIAKV